MPLCLRLVSPSSPLSRRPVSSLRTILPPRPQTKACSAPHRARHRRRLTSGHGDRGAAHAHVIDHLRRHLRHGRRRAARRAEDLIGRLLGDHHRRRRRLPAGDLRNGRGVDDTEPCTGERGHITLRGAGEGAHHQNTAVSRAVWGGGGGGKAAHRRRRTRAAAGRGPREGRWRRPSGTSPSARWPSGSSSGRTCTCTCMVERGGMDQLEVWWGPGSQGHALPGKAVASRWDLRSRGCARLSVAPQRRTVPL